MDFEFFAPIPQNLVAHANSHAQSLGTEIRMHTSTGFPDLKGIKVAIFGVLEDRRDSAYDGTEFNFNAIRKDFYSLFPGNWELPIADLGDIKKGERVEDTYFAVQKVTAQLIEDEIIPIILGGSQDLIYAQYRAYDTLNEMVNLVNIDSRFDLGDADKPMDNTSYIGKIVVNKPYNLFNYSNIGYQSYFNSQDEISLMEKLFFDAYRLGEVGHDISMVEPVMRDANLVGLDMGSVNAQALGNNKLKSPNGFNGMQICALARYAGISDKVSSFGIYEMQSKIQTETARMLVAQILWYFIEGINYRKNENTIFAKNEFIKYQVPIDDEILVFYKSKLSGRWWIEIPFVPDVNTKLKHHTLLPCTENDYKEACDQKIPERWYKTRRKNEI